MASTSFNPPASATRADVAAALARRRKFAEWRFKAYGMVAIAISLGALAILFTTIVRNGYPAFVQSSIKLDVFFDPAEIDPSGTQKPEDIRNANYPKLAQAALYKLIGLESSDRKVRRDANQMLSQSVDIQLRDMVMKNPALIGTTQPVWVLARDEIDALLKGSISRDTPEDRRKVNDRQIGWADKLVADGRMVKRFNTGLFVNGASSDAETAGLGVALIGSFFMMATVLLLAVPLGVAAAIYLQELAPKNRFTDLIEVNINNLAAVPSIVFGLLGLAVFINFAGLPRSASLVGGLVLTLMTLPTIIIATRAAVAAVPPSIREAALGVGASRVQTIFHHVLPLAMPGILTGTIIGLAKALGETAPLLMIGMVAFVIDYPTSPLDSATALPVQVYMWATEAERGFIERTAAATLVLLGFMVVMNAVAIVLRQRFMRKW
ncbi:phosphate ABC transporter permease PstA [Rhodomicrobium vannielii]|uniref:phosphate ABC transporter permease PstA n=1 Tax=Rhodomicrobium vannielii TaxID=1069 RepID=UPI003D7C303F